MNIKCDGHLMKFITNRYCRRSILSNLTTSVMFLVEELSIFPVVSTHEGREILKRFKGIDFMTVIAHQTDGVQRVRLLG